MSASKKSDAVNRARYLLVKKVNNGESPFKILVDSAFQGDISALRFLGDCFYCGDFGNKDIYLAKYIYELANGKTPKAIQQYKEISEAFPSAQNANDLDSKAAEEQHLSDTIARIDNRIAYLQNRLNRGTSAYFLEGDVQADFLGKREEIRRLTILRASPYYGRLDVFNGSSTKTYYISEENFGLQNDIVSVWSPFGRHYRQKFELEFSEKGIHYVIKRRRQLDIADGALVGILDTYVEEEGGSTDYDSPGTTFDPFLIKVLEQKRGETSVSNIIRSIQSKQNDIIDYDFDKNLIVQGCPGSGKTMVLLHRLANLKYNRPYFKWSTVKIITPNEQFNTYIDSLSENLGINMIPRRSLAGYYLDILQCYEAAVNKDNDSDFSKIKKDIRRDSELPKVLVQFIYSNEFAALVQEELKKKVKKKAKEGVEKEVQKEVEEEVGEFLRKKSFADKRTEIKKHIKEIIETKKYPFKFAWGRDGAAINANAPKSDGHEKEIFYQCLLYAEVLTHYLLTGPKKPQDKLLCIDEGQDISQLQYLLLYRVNDSFVCFNIYGDIGQKMVQTCGTNNWSSLQKFIKEIPGKSSCKEVALFHLEENYRNSEEIVSFYNSALGKKDRALGVKIGRTVRYIESNEVVTYCKFHHLLKNRIVVICNKFFDIPNSIRSICLLGEVQENKISLMTVSEVKGLEFDVAFVFDAGMSDVERYIAYTRCLSELYIVNDALAAFEGNA